MPYLCEARGVITPHHRHIYPVELEMRYCRCFYARDRVPQCSECPPVHSTSCQSKYISGFGCTRRLFRDATHNQNDCIGIHNCRQQQLHTVYFRSGWSRECLSHVLQMKSPYLSRVLPTIYMNIYTYIYIKVLKYWWKCFMWFYKIMVRMPSLKTILKHCLRQL